jgi:hypothetical protein
VAIEEYIYDGSFSPENTLWSPIIEQAELNPKGSAATFLYGHGFHWTAGDSCAVSVATASAASGFIPVAGVFIAGIVGVGGAIGCILFT